MNCRNTNLKGTYDHRTCNHSLLAEQVLFLRASQAGTRHARSGGRFSAPFSVVSRAPSASCFPETRTKSAHPAGYCNRNNYDYSCNCLIIKQLQINGKSPPEPKAAALLQQSSKDLYAGKQANLLSSS